MGQLLNLQERRNKYRTITPKADVVEALRDLRQTVENQGSGTSVRLINGIYQQKALNEVQTAQVPPWVFGYKVEPSGLGLFLRTLFIKLPNEDILGIPEKEREEIMAAVYETLIDEGNELPEVKLIARDCIRLTQQFAVVFWHEKNPGIVTPGKKG